MNVLNIFSDIFVREKKDTIIPAVNQATARLLKKSASILICAFEYFILI